MDPPPYLSHAADFLEGPHLLLLLPPLPCFESLCSPFLHCLLLAMPSAPQTAGAAGKSCRLLSKQGEDKVFSLVGAAEMLSITIPSGAVLSQAHLDPESPILPFHEGCPPSYQSMRSRLISHLPSAQTRAFVNLPVRDTALCSQDFLSLEIFCRRKSFHAMSSVCKLSPTSWQWNLLAVLWHHRALPG